MQSGVALKGFRLFIAKRVWLWSRYIPVFLHYIGEKVNLHKEILNRLIEPWIMTEVVARDRKHTQHVARTIHFVGLLFLYANYHVKIVAMEIKKALGVDIGNVIINNRLNDPEVNKVDETVYASFPPSEGVFDSLKTLNDYFKGEVYLLSKCTEWAQEQILLWLKAHDFYTKTGVKEENVYFVRQRHEKDGVCRKLGITHFIDDRLEVLSHMVESTPNLILFQPDDAEVKEFEKFLSKVIVANDWKDVLEKIK